MERRWGQYNSVDVYFVGPQFGEDKTELFRVCDAFILPSFSEGFPMAVLEAWAFAKPVLMTPGCNIPEGFQADAALHIDPTIESMSAGFTTLLSFSDEDLTRMGERGLALVKEKFTWQRVASCVHTLSRWVVYGGQMPPFVYRNSG